jgi:uridine phosphorylase
MKDSKGVQYHIHCKEGDVGRYVFLPGDPARSEIIAKKFDKYWKVAENREFVTFTGLVDGVKVSVTSTGIGGPSTAIALEELSEIGADTFIRVGGGGGIQPNVNVGDLVIATSAVRDDGTSQWYIPMEYPAIASHDVVSALIQSAEDLKKKYHVGITLSKAAFYGQEFHREIYPSKNDLNNRWNAWIDGDVLVAEMEAAVIFVLASIKRKRAGCIIKCGGNPVIAEADEGKNPIASVYSKEEAIEVAINCIRILSEWDKKKGGAG